VEGHNEEIMQINDVRGVEVAAERVTVKWRDFQLLFLGACMLLALIAIGDQAGFLAPIRLILGFVYIFFAPGYCLVAALFPRADDLDGIERLGLTIGLSIAHISLLALLLDALPWGIRLWPIAFGECGVIALFSAIALWRRAHIPTAEVYAPTPRWRPRRWWRSFAAAERRIYTLLAATALVVGVFAAWIFLVPANDQFMTEFYMLGRDGLAERYPYQVSEGEELALTFGIVNRERDERSYRVEVWVLDSVQSNAAELVATAGPFRLQPGEKYQAPIAWRMPTAGTDQKVELRLFSNDDPNPYRQLQLWLDVRTAQ
jgi:uncharacterized membrane protein